MKVKTAELIGDQLDLAVSIAHEDAGFKPVAYSTKSEFGGPIMDEAEIDTYCHERNSPFGWHAEITGTKFKGRGPTRLIAACRCYVASKLGDEIELLEELE
jgi:hypothetical protein